MVQLIPPIMLVLLHICTKMITQKYRSTTYVNNTNDCTIKLDFVIVIGKDEGGPGSLIGSCFCLNISASCSILWEDSNMASAERSSRVTKSTRKIHYFM